MYAPRFKQDIILVMDGKSSAKIPPTFLPASIAAFLAQLCDLSDEAIGALWDLLKDVVWSWEEKVQTIDARYQLYGHNLGYRRFFSNMRTISTNSSFISLRCIVSPQSFLSQRGMQQNAYQTETPEGRATKSNIIHIG